MGSRKIILENSVADSLITFLTSGAIRAGNYFHYVNEYAMSLAVSDTFVPSQFVAPLSLNANEALSYQVLLSGTVRGSNEAAIFSGSLFAATDGAKSIGLIPMHDSITGQYGITSITTGGAYGGGGAYAHVNATGGITQAITIDWRLLVTGAVHQDVGPWC